MKIDNVNSCESHFWYVPIDNGEETICFSDKTYWRVKYRYISDPLNVTSNSQVVVANSDTWDTKPISNEKFSLSD